MTALFQLVEPWLFGADSDDLVRLRDHLTWLQKELFDEYEPNRYESFDDRLAEWLENVEDSTDRKWLFRLLDHLFFVGKRQFDSLCRAAFGDQTTRWIIDQAGIDILDANVADILTSKVRHTWFCPITDSMRINSFLKVNSLEGHDYRPDWHSLEKFGDQARIREYVANARIERLVLLEDFVGSGTQMQSTVVWAARALPTLPVLVIPLVCCPAGLDTGTEIANAFDNVTFSPTLLLRPELFLSRTRQADEPEAFTRAREIIEKVKSRLGRYEHHPFGFESTGALVALYSNCPDNTLPIIHHDAANWAPLFPRIRRN